MQNYGRGRIFSVEPTRMWVKGNKSARILCNEILVTTGCRRFLREGRDGFCRNRKRGVWEASIEQGTVRSYHFLDIFIPKLKVPERCEHSDAKVHEHGNVRINLRGR